MFSYTPDYMQFVQVEKKTFSPIKEHKIIYALSPCTSTNSGVQIQIAAWEQQSISHCHKSVKAKRWICVTPHGAPSGTGNVGGKLTNLGMRYTPHSIIQRVSIAFVYIGNIPHKKGRYSKTVSTTREPDILRVNGVKWHNHHCRQICKIIAV